MDIKNAVGKVLGAVRLNQIVNEFFALDIGTTAVRVCQLTQKTPTEWHLTKYAVTPIDEQTSTSSAIADRKRLGEVILETVKAANITTKNVAAGVPSSKVFSTVIEVMDVPERELPSAVSYQAENVIPTNADETKIDWALLGQSLANKEKLEVLITSVTNEYVEGQLDFLEDIGLNVISFEPDSIALARAILPRNITSNHVIIDVGDYSTDILVTVGDNPRLIRSVSFGLKNLVRTASGGLNIKPEEAEQYIFKFGLNQQALEGKLMLSINTFIEQFTTELNKTIKYVNDKYPGIKIDSSLLSGYSVMIPGFAELIASHVGGQANFATPWQNVVVPPELQQQVAPISAQFAVVVGLAEKEVH
ncbi:MAG: pilus assembly protein PilM [Candidatus Nomurabacteria bacterium]|jgi:type IV pilus assembly protein PilM|nr:pilus assembly protein PilM [Candidatus Nomurabacteria bacterium]